MGFPTLIATDTTVVFLDLQEGIINIAMTADVDRLRRSAGALAELAAMFALPVAISCVPTTSGVVAPTLTEITSQFPAAPQYVRNTADAFADQPLRALLDSSGRRTIIIAGVATEVAVALAAAAAHQAGYAVVIAVDACGGLDARTEAATFTQLSVGGVTLSSVPAIAATFAGDFTTGTGRATMRVMSSLLRTAHHDHANADNAGDGHATHDHEHRHGAST